MRNVCCLRNILHDPGHDSERAYAMLQWVSWATYVNAEKSHSCVAHYIGRSFLPSYVFGSRTPRSKVDVRRRLGALQLTGCNTSRAHYSCYRRSSSSPCWCRIAGTLARAEMPSGSMRRLRMLRGSRL